MFQRLELDLIVTRLTKWFESKLPKAREIIPSGFERPSIGLSNVTYRFGLQWKEARQPKSVEVAAGFQKEETMNFAEGDVYE